MAKSRYKSREPDSDSEGHITRHRSKHELNSSYGSDSDDHKSSRRHRSDKSRKSSGRHKKRRHSSLSSDSESEVSSGRSQSPRRKEPNEEEIVEYLAKKAYRKALKVAKRMKAPEVSGYSNDSNPFGDSNLTQKFVWKKKIEKDVAKDGVSSLKDLSVKAEKERQKRLMSEIEKVKKRREERALEKARREEEMAMLARERARAEFEDWEQKEEEFHFEQSKVRAEIRVNEGRAKPIDVLSKNLAAESFIEIAEPYEVFKGRSINEMLELRQDIKLHLELDRATPTHVEFWEAMITVCDWEVSEARKRDALDRARVRGEEPAPELVAEDMGIHSSIAVDVEQRLGTMSFVELEKWQEKIESDMRTGSAKVVEYWEALLKRIHIFKAKARLREIHEGLRQKHLQQMQFSNPSEHQHKSIGLKVEHEEMLLEDPGLLSQIPEAGNAKEEEDNEAGSFSPELLHVHEGDEVVDPDLDKEELELRRARVLEEQQQRFQEAAGCSEDDSSKLTGQERALVLNAMGAMEEGDAILGSNSEVNLKAQIYWWHDKYRPRKPKYFNRVHTGYEWNKYNQTHYDHDNPPPKIVQGYKFNIFYPDLVDKSKTPTYYIERDGNSDETCMIRFHSGAPYEDIAFRIVNKEWEYSHKKGFKCTFERGILHLYFNFKRYRYRR